MARANKCDRCGTLYERKISYDSYRIVKILPYIEDKIDLCEDCQRELEAFMKQPTNMQTIYKKEKDND